MPELLPDPALILETAASGKPGTHVLLIGIETYPYLSGGPSHVAGPFAKMGQLTSASRSARALASWFLEHFDNCDQPLASVALVLSEPAPAIFSHERLPLSCHALPRGSLAEMTAAVRAWARRSASHPDNLAVLYFCGHGIAYSGGQLLLGNDFGACPDTALQATINLPNLIAALETRPPRHQLILADCCREPIELAQSVLGKINLGNSVIDPASGPVRTLARLSVHTSTSDMSLAFGRRSGLTFFVEALIGALNGGGAQSDMGDWVGTLGLQAALAAYVLRAAEAANVKQEPEQLKYARFRLHKPVDVMIPLHVMCEPRAAILGGSFEARSRNMTRSFKPTPQSGEIWSPRLPPGDYEVEAVFDDQAAWVNDVRPVKLYPPETSCELRPARRRSWVR